MLHLSTYVIKENYPDSRSGKCEMALGLFKPYAGAELWSQILVASSLTTPTWVLKDQITLPLSIVQDTKNCLYPSLWFLDLLPPRAARCFCCSPVSLLCKTLTRSICLSCWIWWFYFIIESKRNGHWVLPSQYCHLARMRRTECPHTAEHLPVTEHSRCSTSTTCGSVWPKTNPIGTFWNHHTMPSTLTALFLSWYPGFMLTVAIQLIHNYQITTQ